MSKYTTTSRNHKKNNPRNRKINHVKIRGNMMTQQKERSQRDQW